MSQPELAKPPFQREQPAAGQHLDRLPPHSLEAERSLLGSILLQSQEMNTCEEAKLGAEYFYDPKHQTIYQVMRDMHQERTAIDLVTLTQTLSDRKQLERAGGAAYVTDLAGTVATAANLPFYLDIVREKFLLRQVIVKGTTLVQEAYEQPEDVDEFIEHVEKDIFSIRQGALRGNLTQMNDAVHTAMENIDKAISRKSAVTGLATGFEEIDRKTAGFQKGNLVIIAARPGMGKTSFALNIAEHVAVELGHAVGIFSLEMSVDELTRRLISSRARVNAQAIMTGFIDQQRDFPRLTAAASVLSRAKMYIDDTGGLKLGQLMAVARRMKQQYDIQMLVVDYLQLLSSDSRQAKDSRQNEISEISRSLKALAKELEIPVLALSQLNRKLEDDSSKRPKLSHLRESGSIEQDADIVLLLARKEYYAENEEEKERDRGKAECIIAKNRNGPTDDVDLVFLAEFTRFENPARQTEPEDME